LPYFDGAGFSVKYDNQVAWDQAPNAAIALQRPNIYSCPSVRSDKDTFERLFTAYSILTGPRTIGADANGTPLRHIEDGLSQTLLVVEACGAQIVWTEPRDVNVGSQPTGVNLNGNQRGHSAGWLSSYHQGGTHVALADGSVRFASDNISPTILMSLALIDDVRPGSF
jgi:prepilin-type processing-associated H-X9-DG protein